MGKVYYTLKTGAGTQDFVPLHLPRPTRPWEHKPGLILFPASAAVWYGEVTALRRVSGW